MKKLLFLFICLLVANIIFAQTQSDTLNQPLSTFSGYHKNIFMEGLGPGLFGSINYDMRLHRGRMDGIGFRAVIGGAIGNATYAVGDPIKFDCGGVFEITYQDTRNAKVNIVSFPMEVNYLVDKKISSFIAGVGVLPVYITIPTKDAEDFGLIDSFLSLGYPFNRFETALCFK